MSGNNSGCGPIFTIAIGVFLALILFAVIG